MDIKLLTFGKWHIPKIAGVSSIDTQFNYVGLGCYDLVNISNLNCEAGPSVYNSMYDAIKERQSDFEVDSHWYIERQIVIFRDRSDFVKSDIDTNEPFFVTLINSQYASLVQTNTKESFEKKIKNLFKSYGKEDKYLLFYTLDCADYVLFAQDIDVEVYCKIIKDLNLVESICKLINDTASLYCLPMEMVKNSVLSERSNSAKAFRVGFNIGVRDLGVIARIKNDPIIADSKPRLLGINLGRDDYVITLTLRNDFELAYVFRLFDSLSSSADGKISYFESAIGRIRSDSLNKSLNKPVLDLEVLINNVISLSEEYFKKAKEFTKEVDCITQIRETANSIIAILRGGFALSFIPCVYEPFCDFLEYSITYLALQNLGDNELQDYELFCMSFLDKLKRLMFSTMHSTHHSIQVTTCNSFYFDVAPKLLAFYSIYINDIAKVIGADRHAFLFSPDIKKKIVLDKISPEKDEKNIVSITLGEHSFYDPKNLIDFLDHEVGHFVGKDTRNRGLRKECFIKIALNILLRYIIPYLDEEFVSDFCDEIYVRIQKYDLFASGKSRYSYELKELIPNIPLILGDPAYADELVRAAFAAIKRQKDISLLPMHFCHEIGIDDNDSSIFDSCDYEQIAAWISEKIINGFHRVLNFPKVYDEYVEQVSMIIEVLREGFSDIVMWALGDIDEKKYDALTGISDQTLTYKSKSTFGGRHNGLELRYKAVSHVIRTPEYQMENGDYQLQQIIIYLAKCRSSLKPDMSNCIFSQEDIKTIVSFSNSKMVFDTINAGISKYIDRLIAEKANCQPDKV